MRRTVFVYGLLFALVAMPAAADIADLQAKINAHNQQIADIEKDIAAYQAELDTLGGQANTLKNAIAALDVTRKKLLAQITATEDKIVSATLSIDALTENIGTQEVRIGTGDAALGKMLRILNANGNESFLSTMMSAEGFSGAWRETDALHTLQARLAESVRTVRDLKAGLEDDRSALDAKRRELSALKTELSDQKKIADTNRAEQSRLLSQTKNTEANYQKQLQDKLALRDSFAQELLEYEMQLKFELDPSKLPTAGSGVLHWPLDSIKITQYFGNTPFAKSGAYNGQGHNGVDFRAAVGTPVKAALGGVVRGTGDTDTACRGASYGKWILIEHGNGLSTLYAHLSLIRVAEGQTVNTGEVVGYSGSTGYATGPHLHFTVFATQGVEVATRPSKVCNAVYTMPIANVNAYLNPLAYL